VLVSGGLDSATTLSIARHSDFSCYALSVEYGQRHNIELEAAKRVVNSIGVEEHQIVSIDLAAFGGSALTDVGIEVPQTRTSGIPITYVPARNTVFLALALAWAEVLKTRHVFIGVNAVDYSGYPDCRREFIDAFTALANLGTRAGDQGERFEIHAPLIELHKSDIIRLGLSLGVDYATTISCYQPDSDGRACGGCDSCEIRRAGFETAGAPDPTVYR